MYNYFYKLFEDNKLIYNLHFGFRQKHSTSYALIHLTDKICEQLDNGKYGCGFFVDFQKALDTVITQFLPKSYITMKLEVTQIIGFLHILKIEHNSSLLRVLIQILKKLTVVAHKGQC